MASYFTLTLDTTAPAGGSISITSLTNARSVTVSLFAEDAAQMKLYGDVGPGSEATGESAAGWETYAESRTVQLTDGDGSKTVFVRFRDAVGNESAAVSATTVLDTAAAVVTVTGPDVSTVSTVDGYDECAFSFSADSDFVEYMVRVVPAESSVHTAGAQIGTEGGSVNMSGTGDYPAATAVSCVITGADLQAASSGDGVKTVKVFVRDAVGNWSV